MQFYADYRLLLPPPQPVVDQIARYKRATAKRIGEYPSMNSPAHISVTLQGRRKPYVVEPALNRKEKLLNTMPPVLLHVNGFKYFNHGPAGRTIYADIQSTESSDRWFKLLFQNLDVAQKGFTPHITVVRDIDVDDFNKLWPHFAKAILHEPFMIDRLLVHRRDTFFGQEWEKIKEIRFLNKLTI